MKNGQWVDERWTMGGWEVDDGWIEDGGWMDGRRMNHESSKLFEVGESPLGEPEQA